MAKINLAIRGIDADLGDSNGDSFFDDKHPTLKADIVLANPPFNLKAWGQEKLTDDVRWKYGIPPANNANYAWIQHMIHHLYGAIKPLLATTMRMIAANAAESRKLAETRDALLPKLMSGEVEVE